MAAALLVAGCPRQAPPRPTPEQPSKTAPAEKEGKAMESGVTIQYYGHACFVVTDSKGTRVALDPYGEGVGYPRLSLTADICLVSHDHFDHNNTAAVSGSPEIIRTEGPHTAKGISILGVTASHHEPGQHAERGNVVMFRWVMDGIALLHCGDLGTPLNEDQIKAVSPVDILMVPVGGFYTIDASAAVQVVDDLKPRVVIPMHYQTEDSAAKLSQLAKVDAFLQTIPSAWVVARLQTNSVVIPKAELEKKDAPIKVIVMGYR
jgi:L-ascorbate metabolism protein UlaG (beta-lactamase superfamily)